MSALPETLDISPALEFICSLTGEYWPDDDVRIEIRCLHPTDEKQTRRRWFPLTAEGWQNAARYALYMAERWNVYAGVLPRYRENGTRRDVPYFGWLWCDIDGGTAGVDGAKDLLEAAVRTGPIPAPHMTVISGSGLHCYWKLDCPRTLVRNDEREHRAQCDRLKSLLRRLVAAIGGTAPDAHADSTRADTASILRIPGTWNHKTNPALPVTLQSIDLDRTGHSFEWWEEFLPALPITPAPERLTTTPAKPPSEIPRWVLEWLQEPAPEGSRHRELIRVGAYLKRDYQFSDSAVWDLLTTKAQRSPGAHPITEREIEGIIIWL